MWGYQENSLICFSNMKHDGVKFWLLFNLLKVTFGLRRAGWCDNCRPPAVWSCQCGDPVQIVMTMLTPGCDWPRQKCRQAAWQSCVSGDKRRQGRGSGMSRGCSGEHTAPACTSNLVKEKRVCWCFSPGGLCIFSILTLGSKSVRQVDNHLGNKREASQY